MQKKLHIVFPVLVILLSLATPVCAVKPIVVGGSGADLETFRMLWESFEKQHPNSQINVLPSIGSGGAVRGVLTGRVDIGLLARPLYDKEKHHSFTMIHYANTALVYVVAKGHFMTDVDVDILKNIYSGEGKGAELTPILRPKADSDTLLIENKLPELKPALAASYDRKGISVGMTDQATLDMLMNADNAITTSTLSLIVSEKRPVKVLSLNGVTPDYENVLGGNYPLRKKLFMLHDRQITALERQFVDFVLSEDGRAILGQTGHVPAVLQ